MRKSCKKQPVTCGFNPSDNAYEPLKLMQSVILKTNEVCLRYLDNSMLCSLPSPGPPYNLVTCCAIRNSRRRMEDRHVVVHDLNTIFNDQESSPSSYYAIFDGHAGHDAAAYSAAHLHQFLAESKYFASNPEQALKDAFRKTDTLFIEKCKVENFSSGTTAVCALLRPKEKSLYIAWVGDSQALLANQGRILQCVNPHKPCRQDEKNRIEEQGGIIIFWGTWRVNGQLAVSRAIGDSEYKPYVIAEPDVREIPLSGTEDFLIIACDGLWDFLSEEDAATLVYRMIYENPDDTESVSQRLVQLSKEQGSSDNISVIVVFLREPSKIAAEAHWAARNTATMDAGLDNANATNNPFTNSNGSEILTQKDGFLLNLHDGYKSNGTTNDYFLDRSTNGKRLEDEFDEDDDLGPETDVDAVDDVLLSPAKISDQACNNNAFAAFERTGLEEKVAMEIDMNFQKHEAELMEGEKTPREETPTPPIEQVHDAGLVDNVAESGEDSEDEWNYYKGDTADKENIAPSQTDKEVSDITEEAAESEDNMSQLNPDAAEFVPISPTRVIESPACRALKDDPVLAQSPKRGPNNYNLDINLPSPQDFENEVKNRPSEIFSNGHENGHKLSSQEIMENLLNGKNIDEIEFQPTATTPVKVPPSEEFHFGPNATPFSTPGKFLDQSESLSTKANFGDESTASYMTKGFDSPSSETNPFLDSKDATDFESFKKEQDTMSMSFYQDKEEEGDPFDLNKVQVLPENVEEFISKPIESSFNDTISDLPEHQPTENGDMVTTDLDKREDEDLLGVCELPKSPLPSITPEPTLNENLCNIPASNLLNDIEPTEEHTSKSPFSEELSAKSPEPLSAASPEPISETVAKSPEQLTNLDNVHSPEPLVELICAKSPIQLEENLEEKSIASPELTTLEPTKPIEEICNALTPEPILTPEVHSKSLLFDDQLLIPTEAQSVIPTSEILESPICEKSSDICEAETQEAELGYSLPAKSPEPQSALIPETDVCAKSTEDVSIKSPEPAAELSIGHEEVHSPEPSTEEICAKSPELLEPEKALPEIVPSPVPPFGYECRLECSLPLDACPATTTSDIEQPESPHEDVTSSVKDDEPLSPVESEPIEKEVEVSLSYAQEISNAVQENIPAEIISPLENKEFEQKQNDDVFEEEQKTSENLVLDPPEPRVCVYPMSMMKKVTDEDSIVASDDLLQEIPSSNEVPATTEQVPLLELAQVPIEEPKINGEDVETLATSAPIIPAVATTTEEKKTPAKSKATSITSKRPASTTTPKTATSPLKSATKPPTQKAAKPLPSASSPLKSTVSKTTASSRLASTNAKTPITRTAPPKPKPAGSPITKAPIEKKATGTDVKTAASKTTTAIKKTAVPSTANKLATKPAVPKMSPTKPIADKVPARPATAPGKTTTLKTTTTTAPKPWPNTLTTKAPITKATSAPTRTTNGLKASPRTTAPAAPKPKPPTTAAPPAPKPRPPPITRPTAKAPDAEKQNKENVNKQTASRATASTRTTTLGSATNKNLSARKSDPKVGAIKTTSKMSTTTLKTSVTKKVSETSKNGPITKTTTKTSTTKVMKPKENGVTSTTEITMVNITSNNVDEQLIKDLSPVENVIIDNSQLTETTIAD